MVTLDSETTRIVKDIRLHALQLPFLAKNNIVIAFFPQSRQFTFDKFFINMVTSHFETINHLTQVYWNTFLNKDDKVNVIRHQLKCPNSNLRIKSGNIDKRLDNSLSKWTRLHNSGFSLTVTLEGTK